MKVLTLVLADAGIELVPKEIASHPAVKASARRRGKRPTELLLDISIHYPAMRKLKDREKRGRPDIAHICMLIAQSSMLNRFGMLKLLVHTYRGHVIEVAPQTRLPRNYNRFVGLIEQLLMEGKVPPKAEKPLLRILGARLTDVLKGCDVVVLLSEEGTPCPPRELASRIVEFEKPAVLVGAFQRGDFSDEVKGVASLKVSIAPEPLDAWTVVARVLCSVEDVLELYERALKA